MKNPVIKKILHVLGYVLTLLSFVYIYFLLKDSSFELRETGPRAVLFIVVYCIVSALFPFISAFSWKLILEFVSRRTINFMEAFSIYVKSNIAKYLPGNIMQYVGRNYLGVKFGWTNAQLALSTILEIVCMITVPFTILIIAYLSGLWTLPSTFTSGLALNPNAGTWLLITVGIAVLICLAFYILRNKFPGLQSRIRNYASVILSVKFLNLFLKIFFISLVSFFLNGFLFYSIGHSLFGFDFGMSNFISITCSLTIAGYSGVLTPGVPGGIGVKESVSVLLLSAYGFNKEIVIMILIASRLFSIIGDLLAFVAVYLTKHESPKAR